MSAIRLFVSSAIGAALGSGLYFVIADLTVGQNIPDDTILLPMGIFGLVFGLISAAVHSHRLPTFISSVLCGVASVFLIIGIVGLLEGHHIAVTSAADVLKPAVAVLSLALLMSLGGWLGLRIAAEHNR
jgi:hypothetical protein